MYKLLSYRSWFFVVEYYTTQKLKKIPKKTFKVSLQYFIAAIVSKTLFGNLKMYNATKFYF